MTAILGFVTFSTYAGLGNTLNPQRVFTSLALLNFAKLIFVEFVIFCLLQTTELSVSLKRIEVIIQYIIYLMVITVVLIYILLMQSLSYKHQRV